LAVGVAVAAGLSALGGCTFIKKTCTYVGDRVNDTLDMVDFGVTVTGKRCYSAYACGGGLFTVGGGYVDGYFVGIGGSRIGIMRHYHKAIGLILWSYEEFGWRDFDRNKPETLSRRHVGVLGWLLFPRKGECVGFT